MIKLLNRLFSMVLFSLVAGMSVFSPAVALAVSEPPAPEGHSDGVAYLLVIFCIALAIIILARGSNRSPDVRLTELEEE